MIHLVTSSALQILENDHFPSYLLLLLVFICFLVLFLLPFSAATGWGDPRQPMSIAA